MRKMGTVWACSVLAAIVMTSPALSQEDGSSSGPAGNGAMPSNQQLLFRSEGGLCRDCFEAGVTLRTAVNPGSFGAQGTIAVPANVFANAVYAQLFWVTLDNQMPPNTERFNGALLNRVACGPVTGDPCWPTNFAYAWRADVLPMLQSGVNLLTDFPDNGVQGGAPNTEGATLVVVFNTRTIDKEILIFCGNDLIDAGVGNTNATLTFPPIGPVGIGADLTFVVGDGQVAADEAYWNGIALDNDDAFQGLDPGPGSGYWDTLKFGVGIGPVNTAAIDTGNYPVSDCLNWVATVLCTKRGGCVVPTEPSTWSRIKTLIDR